MKKTLKLLTILFALMMFSSCGAKGDSASENGSSGAKYQSSYNSSVVVETDRKLTYNVSYNIYSKDYKDISDKIGAKTTEFNGYIENSSVTDSYAEYTYRVPTTKLDDFVKYVDTFDGVGRKTINVDDVTDSFSYTQARIDTLNASKTAYQTLLNNTTLTMTEIIAINDKLDDINTELASINNRMAILVNEIDYATISIDYSSDYIDIPFFQEYFENIAEFFVGLGKAILYIIPIGATFGGIGFGIYKVVASIKKKIKNKGE